MSYSKCELDFLEEVRKERLAYWRESDDLMAYILGQAPISMFANYPVCAPNVSLEHYREIMAAYLKEAAEG